MVERNRVLNPPVWSHKMSDILYKFLTLVFALAFLGCRDTRRPNIYLIPQGYVGWARVEYKMKGKAPLPIQNGYNLLKIPPNGLLRTSSIMASGSASDEFYYVDKLGNRQLLNNWDGWGGKMMIWGAFYEQHGAKETWFVGTEKQFRQIGESRTGSPSIGPINVK